jgi:hypothetical protein
MLTGNERSFVLCDNRVDMHDYTYQPVLSKTDSTGRKLWSTYRNLTRPGKNEMSVEICESSKSHFFILGGWAETYSAPYDYTLTRISPTGEIEWSLTEVLKSDSRHRYYAGAAFPTQDDGCLVPYFESPGGFNYRSLRLRKYAADGTLAWNRDETVFEGSGWGMFEIGMTRGPGGEIYFFIGQGYGEVLILKYHPDGYALWDHEGVRVSANPVFGISPYLSGFYPDGSIGVIYSETPGDSLIIMGQRISPDGERLWGDHGKKLRGELYSHTQYTRAGILGDTTILIDQITRRPDIHDISISISAYDGDGNEVWNQPEICHSKPLGSLALMSLSAPAGNQRIFTWLEMDSTGGTGRIRAQNVRSDGTFGTKTSRIERVNVWPAGELRYDAISRTIWNPKPDKPLRYFLYTSSGESVASGIIRQSEILPPVAPGIYLISATDGKILYSSRLAILN